MSEIEKQLTHQLQNGDIDIETFNIEYEKVQTYKKRMSNANPEGCVQPQQKRIRHNNAVVIKLLNCEYPIINIVERYL